MLNDENYRKAIALKRNNTRCTAKELKYFMAGNMFRSISSSELEHQIGRFNAIKKALSFLAKNNIEGDILEYGAWQGHSLYNILYLLENIGITNKKLIGIDGFIGIPMDYEHANQPGGMFSDTSEQLVLSNIKKLSSFYKNQANNYFILKALYNEKDKIKKFLLDKEVKKISFIHLDCDVYPSCEDALSLLLDLNLLSNTFFLHFDDWGLGTEIPKWFNNYKVKFSDKWKIEELYQTDYTKTIKFTSINQ